MTMAVPAEITGDFETELNWLYGASAVTVAVAVALAVAHLVLWILIARKAGYSGWWAFFGVIIPPLGTILFVVFALSSWPVVPRRQLLQAPHSAAYPPTIQ